LFNNQNVKNKINLKVFFKISIKRKIILSYFSLSNCTLSYLMKEKVKKFQGNFL